MTPNETAERAAFELWFYGSKYAQVVRPSSHTTQTAWDAWLARAASPVTPQEDQAVASQADEEADDYYCPKCGEREPGVSCGDDDCGMCWPDEDDPADIIAGALQCSRGYAYELMREAVEATPSPRDCDSPASGESALVGFDPAAIAGATARTVFPIAPDKLFALVVAAREILADYASDLNPDVRDILADLRRALGEP